MGVRSQIPVWSLKMVEVTGGLICDIVWIVRLFTAMGKKRGHRLGREPVGTQNRMRDAELGIVLRDPTK